MGYVARSIDIEGLKKGLVEFTQFINIPYWTAITTSYTDVVNIKEVDVTDIDYLAYHYYINCTAGTVDFKIIFDTTDKVTDSVTNTSKRVSGRIDCTALTGTVVLKVQLKRSAGSSGYWAQQLALWGVCA